MQTSIIFSFWHKSTVKLKRNKYSQRRQTQFSNSMVYVTIANINNKYWKCRIQYDTKLHVLNIVRSTCTYGGGVKRVVLQTKMSCMLVYDIAG